MAKFKHVAGPKTVSEKEREIEFRLEMDEGPELVMYENGLKTETPYVAQIKDGYLRLYEGIEPEYCGLKVDRRGRIKLHPDTAKALGVTYED